MSTPHLSIQEAKQEDLVEYLEKLGYQPQRIRNNDYWYLSPLRDEKTASFKVNTKLNAWYDHGIGKGGNIIDFGIIYHRCTVSEFLQRLQQSNGKDLSFHPSVFGRSGKSSKEIADEKQSIRVLDVVEIESPALKGYLSEREIPLEIAKKYCREVRFELYDRRHTAIGFQNDCGGFELRNAFFKGSCSPKSTTLIATEKEYNELSVFEGFFNFLSYQTAIKSPSIQKQLPESQQSFLILNSLSFFEQSRSLIERHQSILLYLDRDEPGLKQTGKALRCNKKYKDGSELYKGFKDLNDFLTNKPLKPEQGKRWGRRSELGASYVLTVSKPSNPHANAFDVLPISEKVKTKGCMETGTTAKKTDQITRVNKGGRPKKSHHLDEKITVMCSRIDVITIRCYAKQLNLTLSEYLRTIGLKRQVDRKVKVLPREVLQLIGTLNHIAANINQIAYKRNRGDELNAIERAMLMALCTELKDLAKAIKTAMK